jgi:Protein of unknown function (DUF3159)
MKEVRLAMNAYARSPADTVDTGPALSTILRGSAWDIGLPVVTYYALHQIGVTDWPALLAATLVAGARVVLTAVRGRTANPFAMLMVVVFGVSLALSFLTGDARFMLMKGSITAAAVGIMFLVMAALGHPLTLDVAKMYEPEKAEWRSEQFRTNPAVRHGYRTASVVWGAGFLIEVIVLVPLIYLLPIHIMVAVDSAVGIGFLGALIGWTGWYQKQAKEAPSETSRL